MRHSPPPYIYSSWSGPKTILQKEWKALKQGMMEILSQGKYIDTRVHLDSAKDSDLYVGDGSSSIWCESRPRMCWIIEDNSTRHNCRSACTYQLSSLSTQMAQPRKHLSLVHVPSHSTALLLGGRPSSKVGWETDQSYCLLHFLRISQSELNQICVKRLPETFFSFATIFFLLEEDWEKEKFWEIQTLCHTHTKLVIISGYKLKNMILMFPVSSLPGFWDESFIWIKK